MPTQASRHGLRVHYTRSAPKTFPSLLFLTGVVLKLSLFLTGVVLKLSLFLTGRSRTRPLRTPPLLLSALLANATLPPATPPSTSIRMIDIFKPCQDPYRQRLQASPLKRLGNVFHQGESMQSLVSYESSSAESEESSPRKKKLKQIAHEESEVSSSVVEGDLNAESIESSATKLLEMGCSFEQVAHAISVCGNNTPVADVFDFIQAQQYHIGDEGCASNFPAPEEDLEIQLREIGFSQEHIAEALEACGKKSSIFEITDYIQARYCSEDPSCSKSSKSNEVRSSGSGDEDGDGATPLQRLQRMGFTLAAVQRASDECNSIDFDDLLEYLVDAKEEDLPTQERVHYEADSSEDEDDDELTSFQKLQRLGFSSASIQKAIETRESLDFEVLLSFLSEDENVNLLPKAGSQVEEDGQKHWAHGKHPSIGLVKKMPTNTDEAGSSRNVSSTVKWTEDQVKLWYTYLGTKKKSNHFSESDVSDNETQQLAWEEKSALKVKKGSRKINFLQSQREDIFKPLQQSKMMGFGIPGHFIGRPRPVPNLMQGPPYFYFENVASVPKSEWDTIKRHLNGVDPEFTDSKFFSASRRPRGYVHNLPVEGRKLILPTPPMTVFEALPDTRKYWPSWDTREKLNCINTRRASETLCGFIRKFFTDYEGMEIPYDRQQEILQACKKWNLVWVGPGQTAPLEPHEIELLLGFDRDHSRGCSTMSDRYDALGNSFQVNTVAYHLSPLKSLYPHGITVLSLFSGIGGAEVALHKLGIFLKTVIAVEINIKTRNVLVSWWKKSGQRGELKLKNDVRELTNEVLAGIIDEVGRIDLIIGGSPCNNLSGNNRVSRVGLSGKESSLFFEFPRILSIVKQIMHERGYM